MDKICVTCSQHITFVTGETRLGCQHIFHPSCIHSYYKGTSKCPVCPVSKGKQLDFGDNLYVANAVREAIYTPQQTQKTTMGWMLDKVSNLSLKSVYPPLCGADELVQWKAPIAEFIVRKITAQNLAESGVTLDSWLLNKYTLEDLQKIGVTWNDFVFMGFDTKMLQKIPVTYLVNVLNADISNLLHIGIVIQDLIDANYKPKDLLALGCTTHTLINMGITQDQQYAFNYTEKEWEMLGLVD